MRNFIAAIAAAIRAMASQTLTWVKVGGRWVAKMVPSLVSAPAPAMEAATAPASAAHVDDLAPVKRVAGIMASGETPTAEQLKGVSEKAAAWLRVLDTRMLSIVAVADRAQLQAHLSGRPRIKGMIPYEMQAVADVKAAKAAARPQRRTLRDRLAELKAQGVHPGI